MKKIWSILLCFIMLFTCIPIGIADASSNNADLSSLVVDGYDLDPVFNAETTEYTVSVPNVTGSVYMIATTADSSASLKINDTAAISGSGETVDSLAVGDNTVVVEVTAQDGTTVNNYTVTINRAAAAANPLPQTPAEYAASDYGKYAARMAVGEAHIAVININGAVGAGGDNTYGQCEVPADLTGVVVKAVAAGSYHTLALTEGGQVFAWGSSSSNASGTKTLVSIPAEVEAVQGHIRLIAAGNNMSAVVTDNDNVIIWGFNSNNLATIPAGLTDISAIALSNNCAVALTAAGNVTVWGASCCTTVPDGLNGNAVAISVGMNHWLALKKNGTVTITGDNGQLNYCGNIVNQTDVRAIAAGWQFAGAILADGSVKGWGRTPADSYPNGQELIAASANIKAFSCTVSGGLDSPAICAMQEDGTIKVLASSAFTTAPITDQFNFLTVPNNNANLSSLEVAGYSLDSAFDAATTDYTVNVPTNVSSVSITATTEDSASPLKINGAVATSGTARTVSNLLEGNNVIPVLVTGADFITSKTYNLTITRAPLSASNNSYLSSLQVEGYTLDQTFDAETTAYTLTVPYEASSLNITATTAASGATLKFNSNVVASGTAQTLSDLIIGSTAATMEVSSADGTLTMTYTLNITRQKEMISLPQTPAAYAASNLAKYASKMAAGYSHLAVIDANGVLTLGGDDTNGQCSSVPAELTGVRVKAVAAGTYHTLALTESGHVHTWGKAVSDAAGTISSVSLPAEVTAVQGSIKLITAGGTMSAVLTNSGKLIVWGYNTDALPTVTEGLSNVTAVAINSHCVVLLDEAGNISVLGNNTSCNVVPDGLNGNVVAIAAGQYHWLALKKDGTVSVTGDSTTKSKCGKINLATNVRAVAGGYRFAGALLTDGAVKGWGTTPTGSSTGGKVLIAADLNTKAFTSIVSDETKSGICAMQGDGTIKVAGYSGFTYSPISDEFNFLTGANDNANLSGLSVAGYDLVPAFAAATTEYTVNIPNDVSSVNISATTADSSAILKINGAAATSGSAQAVNSLAVGDNPVAVEVTAKDGTTVKTYTLTIKRAAAALNNNANLSGLVVSGYSPVPGFAAATTEYTVNIPNDVSSVNITATTADSSATLKINGAAATSGSAQAVGSLAVGDNAVAVAVTAQNGTTVKTYTVTIKRAAPAGSPDDNSLASLTVQSVVGENVYAQVTACALYPEFSSTQTEGIVDVANGITEVRITAQPSSSSATLAINGDPAVPGVAVVINAANLAVGDNIIPIKVTAANGSQLSYTLHVKRVSAEYALPALPQTPEAYQESDYAKYNRRLAIGYMDVLAVKKEGTVIAWGQGNGGSVNIPSGLDNVAAVAAGNRHSLALKKDGTLVAWGSNNKGQCDVPTGLQNIVDISAGQYFSAALDENGQVYAWGDNNYNQCEVPDDLGDVVDIQCGLLHMLALQADGTVVAWGNNNNGQCEVPAGLDHVVAIAADINHSVALKDDGTMIIWGGQDALWENIKNTDLQYFKGISANNRYITGLKWDGSMIVLAQRDSFVTQIGVPLQPEQEILAVISATDDGVLALNKDGTLAAWGDTNTFNKYDIPAGLNLFADDPEPYSGASPDIPQTPAEYAASDYALARDKVCNVMNGVLVLNMDGTVKLAVSAKGDYDYTMPEGLSNVTAIASSSSTLMALKADGTVVVWGYDGEYQSKVPADLGKVTAIATGAGTGSPYCLALQDNGTVAAWGGNTYNQCDVPAGLNNVTAIAAGERHCLALKANGTVAAWGNNDNDQCNVPAGLSNVARIYVGYDFSLALKNDGTVVAWGSNQDRGKKYDCGQCDVPEGLSGVVDITINGQTCTALKNNGTVVVWGNNTCGKRNIPPGLHDVAAVAGSVQAIKTDGSVVKWGYSSSDLLSGLSKVLTISNSTAIFRDGSLQYCSSNADLVNAELTGLNVLSGHYFAIKKAELLSPAGSSITSVASQGGYRIKASVANNNAATTTGLVIIQVRGGSSATGSSGGQVLGCVGLSGDIPVTGSAASSDFTMPAGISGKAYVDVFVWDGWNTMVPRAAANQNLNFTVSN